jgi:hypothetical protein
MVDEPLKDSACGVRGDDLPEEDETPEKGPVARVRLPSRVFGQKSFAIDALCFKGCVEADVREAHYAPITSANHVSHQ